jgi:hypothetical protein
MGTLNTTQKPSFESVWATLQETGQLIKELRESQAETDRKFQETAQMFQESKAENDRLLRESKAEFDRRFAETDRIVRSTSLKVDEVARMVGGMSDNHGKFAEEYFSNSFDNGQREFFGEKFYRIEKNVEGENPGEYDIMLINGNSVAVIETKFRARSKNVNEMYKKAKVFRKNFPEYKSHRLYLGLAAMVFDKGVEDMFANKGIAIIKQVGDTVVINDENLKVF